MKLNTRLIRLRERVISIRNCSESNFICVHFGPHGAEIVVRLQSEKLQLIILRWAKDFFINKGEQISGNIIANNYFGINLVKSAFLCIIKTRLVFLFGRRFKK